MPKQKPIQKWKFTNPMNKGKFGFLFLYTVFFLILFVLGYLPFFTNRTSLMWKGDGMTQHFPALVYLGKYWRAVARSVLNGSPSFPLYDFRLGLGDDIMAPLLTHSANIDSFSLLSIFIPFAKTEALFNAIVVLRLYASGLTFSFFGKKVVQAKPWAILISTFTYVFCGWAIFTAVRHPHFIIAMVYTPLLVTGLDYVLKGKKPHLFILSVFLSALTGYYFLYMQTLFLLIYAFIRVHSLYKKQYGKKVLTYAVKTTGYYLVGLLMASIIFLPLLAAQLNSSRTNHINVPSLLFFTPSEYMDIFVTSISGISQWSSLGMAAIVLIAVLMLFIQKTRYKRHFILALVVFLTIRLIPFGNLMFNGFGYVSTRWTFLLAFLFAALLTYMLPHMIALDKKSMLACIVLITVFGIISIFFYNGAHTPLIGLGFLGLTGLCLFLPHKRLKIAGLTLIVMANLIVNARYTFHFHFMENFYADYGTATQTYASSFNASDYVETPDTFYREKELDTPPNASMIHDYYGVSEYWSMMNPYYSVSMFEHENRQQRPVFWNIRGLDNRTIWNTLASVQYINTKESKEAFIPYGYEKIYGRQKIVYSSPYALPIGYSYSNVLSSAEYERLEAVYKQEAMLQSIVLTDTEEYVNMDMDSLTFRTTPIPYTITESNHLKWENGVLSVNQDSASLTIEFEGLPNSETYVRLAGFYNDELYDATIRFKGNLLRKSDTARLPQHPLYFGKHNYMVHMGYSETAQNKATLTFLSAGTYQLDDIQVFCYPLEDYPIQVESLREGVLEDVVIGTNQVTGAANLKTDKIMCFGIPYSKGWSAKVDGERQELFRANTMFMALPLTAGYHTIELNYVTPGLRLGIVLSLLGAAIFLVLFKHF